jgi:SAM-dependent methyltransferase
MAVRSFDQAKSEAFAGRMLNVLNEAAVALMTSIGHQMGLFDVMADQSPATAEEIAQKAGLKERYVREWLGAMVTGKLIEFNPEGATYYLPPEHSAWLTRAAGLNNVAIQAQYIPLLAQVENEVIDSFRKGGGVPYSKYPRFQKLMAEDSAAVHDVALIDKILPTLDLTERLQTGIDVADIGCGSGHAINLMAQAFPKSRFVGYDFSPDGIAAARAEAHQKGLTNAQFEERDVTSLGASEQFDLITAFDAIHDQAHPAQVLAGIFDALRLDGVFLMVDIRASSHVHENMDHMLGPFLYTVSTMHCMTVSLALDGTGLGTMWGEQTARRMLAEAGFTHVDVKELEDDFVNSYYVGTK